MASAKRNPNYYRTVNRLSRLVVKSGMSPADAVALWRAQKDIPARQRDPRLRRQVNVDLKGLSKAQRRAAYASLPKQSDDTRREYARAKSAIAKLLGINTGKRGSTWSKTKAGAYKWGKKRTKNARGQVVLDRSAARAYNKARGGRRASNAAFDAATRSWAQPGKSYKQGAPKASGMLIEAGFQPPLFPSRPIVRVPGRKKKKRKKSGAKRPAPSAATQAKMRAGLQEYQDLVRQYKAKYGKAPPKGTKKTDLIQEFGGYAMDNPFGALALQNSGYGALALENPVPFVGGVAAETGKLAVVGLAGALGHAFIGDKVEEYLPKIPVVGEKILDLSVPEVVPLIGGMDLDNTVVGAITGGLVIVASKFIAAKTGMANISRYGSALGAGIAVAGPVLDFADIGESDIGESEVSDDELGALALENFGALALENYGDGMAYQLGAIGVEGSDATGDDYTDASLADAHYSGADFDSGEGQALMNGRFYWRRRYGVPPTRIAPYGGRVYGPSHLAQRPGHRWGWLIKMVGWPNVQRLAALPPAQRVSVIKQLRSNAIATFNQLMVQQRVASIAAPELAPAGATTAQGAAGAYGATIFAGAGL